MIEALFRNIIEITLTTSVIIAVLLLISPLLNKKYTAKWRYFLWIILAVRLVIPVNFTLPDPPLVIESRAMQTMFTPAPAISPSEAVIRSNTDADANFAENTGAVTQHTAISLGQIISILWLAGIIIFISCQYISYALFIKSVLRWSIPVRNKRIIEIRDQLLEDMGIKKSIEVMTCKKISSPMMMGVRRPMILLPHEDFCTDDLEVILKHELIHYKRHDIWYKLFLMYANAVHWFNPLVYLMVYEANKDIEISCDEEVVKNTDIRFREQYSEVILSAMRREHTRKTVFSTFSYGSKKVMKERLINILDMSKKRSSIVLLCSVVLITVFSGLFVACRNNKTASEELIDNISLLDSGNSYAFTNGKMVISYNRGAVSAEVPLTIDPGDQAAHDQTGIYISREKTAVAYNSLNDPRKVEVFVSDDMGQTWNAYPVEGAETKNEVFNTKFIGFTTRKDGWLVLGGSVSTGHQYHYIYLTADGGKTWTETGNVNKIYDHVITGAGFANNKIGFICFRYVNEINPVVYRTEDGGKTWEKCDISIPESYKFSYATPYSPSFHGADGVLPVVLRDNEQGREITIRYTTSDYGRTWVYDDTLPAPGEIMSHLQGNGAHDKNSPVHENGEFFQLRD